VKRATSPLILPGLPVGPHPLEYRPAPLRVRRPLASVLTWQIMAWGVFAAFVLGITTIVAPKFEAIFTDFGTALPAATVLVLAISRWVRLEFGWVAIVLLPVAVALLIRIFARHEGPNGKRPFIELLGILLAALLTLFFIVVAMVAMVLPMLNLMQVVR